MKARPHCFAAIVASILISAASFAADPSGNWKWSLKFGDQGFDINARLALTDGKLSGSLESPMGATPISDGTFKDDVVDFTLNIEGGPAPMKIKYHGKLAGDTITGKIDSPGFDGGERVKFDWNATRVKDEAKPAAPAPTK